MRSTLYALAASAVATLLIGCQSAITAPMLLERQSNPSESGILTSTSVALADAPYRVVRSGLQGESRGLTVLIFFKLDSASYTEAMADLYGGAELEDGRPWALANMLYERSGRNFVLFALPRHTVRADLIEFVYPEPEADVEAEVAAETDATPPPAEVPAR